MTGKKRRLSVQAEGEHTARRMSKNHTWIAAALGSKAGLSAEWIAD